LLIVKIVLREGLAERDPLSPLGSSPGKPVGACGVRLPPNVSQLDLWGGLTPYAPISLLGKLPNGLRGSLTTTSTPLHFAIPPTLGYKPANHDCHLI
jgi:hypothetical protein